LTWIVAAVGVAAVAVAIGVAARRPPPSISDQPEVPEHLAPLELVERACRYVNEELPAQIDRNAPAAEVLADIAVAERYARTAADRDVRWVSLASGVSALEVALTEDDPDAADVAMRVLRAECPT